VARLQRAGASQHTHDNHGDPNQRQCDGGDRQHPGVPRPHRRDQIVPFRRVETEDPAPFRRRMSKIAGRIVLDGQRLHLNSPQRGAAGPRR